MSRANSTITFWRYPGRRPIARRGRIGRPIARGSGNATVDLFRSWCMACGRQYERGFPSYCQVPAPRLDRNIVGSMLDLMPSPRLIFHEWDQHGTCSGLSPHAYFENVRNARAAVKIPPRYAELERPIAVVPGEVAAEFLKANPGLSPRAISVFCDRKWLTEVRICLGKDLSFRDCTENRRNACRLDRARMPAVRG